MITGKVLLGIGCLILSCAASAACLAPAGEPITTGIHTASNDGGMGGTGVQAKGGIGGTGIVGTITGFASVCINGLEVDFDEATQVRGNGEMSGLSKLAVGQVIAIEAVEGEHGLRAKKIDILNAVEGLVGALDVAGGTLNVMRQTVRLSDATHLRGLAKLDDIRSGMAIKVSGYRNASNEIVATGIERANGMLNSSSIGVVEQNMDGQYRVAGMPVERENAPLEAGVETLLRGRWDGQKLHVENMQLNPSLPFAGQVKDMVVEGLLIARTGTRQIKISGFDVDYARLVSPADVDMEKMMIGQRVRVTGQLQSGRHIQAGHLDIMPTPNLPTQTGMRGMRDGTMLQDMMQRPMPSGRINSPMPMMRH